ncbi:MFS transporter [Novosphingobium rosa]|uniref:MFS transporter n=1 Tax=Novosphingobium rosa TaxID=76978 RepID=UPI00082FFBF6|nr:MFS transporter [Novosphingobium rosa]
MSSPWPRIVTLWLLGVLAAAQFAKMSVIAPLMQEQGHLTLSQLGWLISLLEVGGGLFGFVAGLALARSGARLFLLAGLAILAATGLMETLTGDITLLFAARAVEGLGYLLVVIAAPTAISAIAHDDTRPRALALWSTFVPVGIALGAAVTGAVLPFLGVRGIMGLWTALIVLGGFGMARMPIGAAPRHRLKLPEVSAWCSTFGFGLYTVFISALTMLLPSFLIERSGASLSAAALIAALASLASLPGAGAAIWSMRDGVMPARRSAILAVVALLATVPLILALYHGAGMALALRGALAVVAVMVSGLLPPVMFARLPQQAGAASPDDPRIATANGLVTQFGAGGALIGPPLGGWIVAGWGWEALGIGASGTLLAMLAMILLAESLAGRREQAGSVALG